MAEQPPMSIEAQLAVLNTKVDQLIGYNKERGADHEERIRALESTYVSEEHLEDRMKRSLTIITIVCVVLTAIINSLAFLTR